MQLIRVKNNFLLILFLFGHSKEELLQLSSSIKSYTEATHRKETKKKNIASYRLIDSGKITLQKSFTCHKNINGT